MSQIIINPAELKTEIDNGRKTNDKIKVLKYNIEKKNLKLNGIDKFLECLNELNSAIVKFGEMTENDLHNLEIVKAQWMNLDEELASKTTFDRISGLFNK